LNLRVSKWKMSKLLEIILQFDTLIITSRLFVTFFKFQPFQCDWLFPFSIFFDLFGTFSTFFDSTENKRFLCYVIETKKKNAGKRNKNNLSSMLKSIRNLLVINKLFIWLRQFCKVVLYFILRYQSKIICLFIVRFVQIENS